MSSQLTKDELIQSIIKRLPKLTKEHQEKLKCLPMKDLWKIDRKITWLIKGH